MEVNQETVKSVSKKAEKPKKLILSFREYQPDVDYPTAKSWWLEYNASHLEKEMLPDLGIVVTYDGKALAMGWVYFSNSRVAQIGWIVSDPKLGPKMRVKAVYLLIAACESLAKDHGYKMVQIFTDRPGLNKMLSRSGFSSVRPHEFFVKVLFDESDV